MVPIAVAKLTELGVREAPGALGTVPVPVSATDCGDPEALSEAERVALYAPAAVGVNVTEIAQVPAGAIAAEQVFDCAKFDAFVPAKLTVLTVRGAVPELRTVITCAAEVVPATWEKVSAEGVTEAPGVPEAVPVPVSATA